MTAADEPSAISDRNASALVVGVGSPRGLGAAIARRFSRGGYAVVIAGRNEKKVLETFDSLDRDGARVSFAIGDASNPEDAKHFVEQAEAAAPLSMVVQNAGSNNPAPFLESDAKHFESHWREHTLAAFHLAQAALPVLLSRNAGTLTFTGASGSMRGKANFASFAAAKGATRMLAQSLAREFGKQGIHVAHFVIDGGIEGERLLAKRPGLIEARGPDGLLKIDAIADAYWLVHHQHRSAWTLEMDLRPWSEHF